MILFVKSTKLNQENSHPVALFYICTISNIYDKVTKLYHTDNQIVTLYNLRKHSKNIDVT